MKYSKELKKQKIHEFEMEEFARGSSLKLSHIYALKRWKEFVEQENRMPTIEDLDKEIRMKNLLSIEK